MKIKLLFFICLYLIINNYTYAQTPTYTLRVDSMKLVSINFPNDAIEFGVYLTHTNAPTAFGLAGTQLFWSFNPAILGGCTLTDTVSCVRLRIIGSQLPVPYQPRNPSIATATSPSGTIMRLAINAFQGTPGLDITGATNLLVVRMRLTKMSGTFTTGYLAMEWRNEPIVSNATKVFAYIADVNTDITTPPTHTIDSSGIPSPIPGGSGDLVNLISPGNNSVNNPLTGNFIWFRRTDALTYRLQISTDPTFSTLFYNDSTITDTVKNVIGFSRFTKYYWNVRSKSSSGAYTFSPVWNFTTVPAVALKLTLLNEGLYYPLFNLLSRRDTIRTYLRNISSPYNIIDSAKGVIDSINFTNKFIYNNALSGTYYIQLKHFNSVETWSKSGGQTFTLGDSTIYDFTSANTQAFGNNLKLKGGRYCMYSGDVNQDQWVDAKDLAQLDNHAYQFLSGRFLPSDLNGDNQVDGADFSIGDNNWRYVHTLSPLNPSLINVKYVKP